MSVSRITLVEARDLCTDAMTEMPGLNCFAYQVDVSSGVRAIHAQVDNGQPYYLGDDKEGERLQVYYQGRADELNGFLNAFEAGWRASSSCQKEGGR